MNLGAAVDSSCSCKTKWEMKIRTVKKVIKECLVKGRKTPLAKKVTLDNIAFYQNNKDKK